ncbi:hypothetical protein C5Y96_02545 [Blastopirellula marina]|uniref:Carboxypeptidase regulatory-like domain-containing protein n=1 Tax=Blastopirellula marina TaxID=124 RepID=A0A2S8G3B6_9BACT|nr:MULTISPECIES: hypothetical protein [Pirellulaceae]PQO38780.1 hypothetical protein C5Y96_02545 [Blastopirellula marina]RCS55088.1 hypothetical protein DTL36_02550 [Bremerella cremea]
MNYRLFSLGFLVFAASVMTGCYGGTESATAFHVRGQVQFDGKPLPAGRIYFTPNASLGNQGPQGTATIEDGKYDTEDSRFGIVGGPYIVRIEGYDGIQPPNDEDGLFPDGQVLFRDYELKLEFPQANHVEDLDIPASASKRK